MSDPYFPFFPNDWLGSQKIGLMSFEEQGVFLHLLCLSWNSDDCGIPADANALRMLCRGYAPSKKVLECFSKEGDRLYNKKLLAVRRKKEEIQENNRKAAKIRWKQCNTNVLRVHSERNANGIPPNPKDINIPPLPPKSRGMRTCVLRKQKPRPEEVAAQVAKKHGVGESVSETADRLIKAWNSLGRPFPAVHKISEGRMAALRQRLKDKTWRKDAAKALSIMRFSDFLRGHNNSGWVADIDFFLRRDTVTKILEGKYGLQRAIKKIPQNQAKHETVSGLADKMRMEPN